MLRSPWESLVDQNSNSTEDPRFRELRLRIKAWLEADFNNVEELTPSSGIAWVIKAVHPQSQLKVLVGQATNRPNEIGITSKVDITEADVALLGSLDEEITKPLVFDIAIRLLQMNLTFFGVSHPLRSVMIQSMAYTDGLTRSDFVASIKIVVNGLLIVIWSVAKCLGRVPHSPPPPSMTVH